MKKYIAIVTLFFISFMLSACNTVQGFGKDVEKSGQALERAATK